VEQASGLLVDDVEQASGLLVAGPLQPVESLQSHIALVQRRAGLSLF